MPGSPTLVPHSHPPLPRTRVRGSWSWDHTACKGLENSAGTGKFTLTRAEAPSPRRPSCWVLRCPPASARSPSGRSRPFQRLPAPCGPALSRQPGSPPCRPPPSVLPVRWGWPCRNWVLEREFILGSGCPAVSASVPPTYGAHQLQPWMEASRGP